MCVPFWTWKPVSIYPLIFWLLNLDTEEVNKALDEIHEEMDKVVVTKTELSDALAEQNSINEALCAENCSARWLWKSGELQNGFAIPWEI